MPACDIAYSQFTRFIAEYTAIELVCQLINGGIQVKVLAGSVQRIALDLDAAFGTLAAFFL